MIPNVKPLFKALDDLLIELLDNLKPEQWALQTVASQWKVKDVVAHLLDGNLRALSIQRDRYFGSKGPSGNSYAEMVDWLNAQNAEWVLAAKRLSPAVLTLLHKSTGPMVSSYYESLDPESEAVFAVDWAGQKTSTNAMHLAREYTEKWHHQQQIRFAVGDDLLLQAEWSKPFWDTIVLGLPHALRKVPAEPGCRARCGIGGAGYWDLIYNNNAWDLIETTDEEPAHFVEIPSEIAWKLFTKSIRPESVRDQIICNGDSDITSAMLTMVAVMA